MSQSALAIPTLQGVALNSTGTQEKITLTMWLNINVQMVAIFFYSALIHTERKKKKTISIFFYFLPFISYFFFFCFPLIIQHC